MRLQKPGLLSAEQMQNVIFAALSVNPRFLFLVRLHYNASYAINEKKKDVAYFVIW